MPLIVSTPFKTQEFDGWFRTFGGSGSDRLVGVDLDSSDNIYVAGYTDDSAATGNSDMYLAKFDSDGNLQWQRLLGGSGDDFAGDLGTDPAGNSYIVAQEDSETTGSKDAFIAKYDNTGAIQWQERLGGANSDAYSGAHARLTGGSTYAVGWTFSEGASPDLLISEYGASGSLNWQRRLGGATTARGRSVVENTSGQIFVAGSHGNANDGLVAGYNSGGSVTWQRKLTDPFNGTSMYGITFDTSSRIYACGRTKTSSLNTDLLVVKYDTNGVFKWARTIGDSGTAFDGPNGQSIIHSSGNLYVIAQTTTASGFGSSDILFVKYDTDGNLQFQRAIGSTSNDVPYTIKANSTGSHVYIVGYTELSGSRDCFIAKVPTDGATTTCGGYGIKAVSLTENAGGSPIITDSAGSLTANTATLTRTTSTTLTDQAGPFTPTSPC